MRDLDEALRALETRVCKCGCGRQFRCLPDCRLVYSSRRCATSAGVNLANYYDWGPRLSDQWQKRRWFKDIVFITAEGNE